MDLDKIKQSYENFSAQEYRNLMIKEALKLVDLKKTETRTFTTFNKASLRRFLKNPKSNEYKIIELSNFLYRLSNQYRREIKYRTQMLDLSAYVVIPDVDITKPTNITTVKKQYQKTIRQLEKINLQSQIEKVLTIAWREDVFFGYVYEESNGFFIMPLPAKFCKISSQNYDGTYNFAFNFSFFRTNSNYLEFWGDEFKEKYEFYRNGGGSEWIELDNNKTMCLKINTDDSTMLLPPLVGLFEGLIDLIDLQSIQTVKDELSIYKLLVARLETLPNAKEPNDFSVDVDSAIDYYNRISDSLPEFVSSCISPFKIEPIEFKGTTSEDTDMISKSMSNLFKSSGSSNVLDGDKINGTIGSKASILSDTLNATGDLLSQIESWVNRYLTFSIGKHDRVKYLRVTPYTKSDMINEYKEAAQYGVPVKLAYASLLGFNPLDVNALTILETECFDIHNNWIPLSSSHTQSSLDLENTKQAKDDNNNKDES